MVTFQHVVEVSNLPVLDHRWTDAFRLQLGNRLGQGGSALASCSGRGHHREFDLERAAQEVRREKLLIPPAKTHGAGVSRNFWLRNRHQHRPGTAKRRCERTAIEAPANCTSGQRDPRDSATTPGGQDGGTDGF